ncbi:MAG: indole-3-glycerol phosphate synthase TrpC [Propionibacteriaceae bacterium]|nr:indole-3-glycerol phosphate synthase TrpC [Propionibacteriaceae bacterium]
MSVLDDIVAGVRADLAQREAKLGLDALVARLDAAPPVRDPWPVFTGPGMSVIAEVKRASPSKGPLGEIPDPAGLAAQYEAGGAAAVSVLTERRRFSGSLADLDAVRARVGVPVLRKDFIVTDYQVYEARVHGADIVLLIVAALSDGDLARLHRLASQLGMRVLVETHTADEVSRALDAGAELVGVNNRDLTNLEVDLNHFARLAPMIPGGIVKVAESGITGVADVARLHAAGADVVLVGEALVRDGHPADTIARLCAVGRD